MTTAKILIIEDEPTLVKLLTYNLEREGYDVEAAEDGEQGLQLAMNGDFDLILLDIMLPEIDGFAILQQLRESGKNTPVIVLTARTAEEEIVKGLTSGADDYITKPFSVAELFARVTAVLRRTAGAGRDGGEAGSGPAENVLTVGDLKVYPDKYEARIKDTPISLRPKEFEILLYFAEHIGLVITRDQLMNAIWGYDYVGGGRTVDVHLSSLRKKLEVGDHSVRFESVRGVGYKLTVK